MCVLQVNYNFRAVVVVLRNTWFSSKAKWNKQTKNKNKVSGLCDEVPFNLISQHKMEPHFSWIHKWFVPDAWAHTRHRERSPSSSLSIRCRSPHLWPHSPKRSWSPIGIPRKSDPRSSSLHLASPDDELLAWWFRKYFLYRLCGIVSLLLFPILCLLFLVRTLLTVWGGAAAKTAYKSIEWKLCSSIWSILNARRVMLQPPPLQMAYISTLRLSSLSSIRASLAKHSTFRHAKYQSIDIQPIP